MNRILGMISIVILLISCRRGQVNQEQIDQLSADWDQAFASVNNLIDQVAEEQYAWEDKFQDLRRLENRQSEIPDSLRRQLDLLLDEYRRQGEAIDAIATEVDAFSIRFDNQTSQLEELESQMAEGREVDNLHEKAGRFRDLLDQLPQQISGWQQRLSAARDQYRQIHQQFVHLMTHTPES